MKRSYDYKTPPMWVSNPCHRVKTEDPITTEPPETLLIIEGYFVLYSTLQIAGTLVR